MTEFSETKSQGCNFKYISGWIMKMRFIISELATVPSVTFYILVTVVGQMVKICSGGRPVSSKLPSKNTLYYRSYLAKWQIFKIGGR